jgi:hypothetical protein
VVSPALLQQAEVSLTFGPDRDYLPRLRSLCAFLQRHAGQHLRGLRLDLDHWPIKEEAALLIAAGVSACAASLEELALQHFTMPVSVVAGMVRLRSLCVHGHAGVSLGADLTPLTRLEQLRLTSGIEGFDPGVALPPSLTFLRMVLQNPTDHALPPQVTEPVEDHGESCGQLAFGGVWRQGSEHSRTLVVKLQRSLLVAVSLTCAFMRAPAAAVGPHQPAPPLRGGEGGAWRRLRAPARPAGAAGAEAAGCR